MATAAWVLLLSAAAASPARAASPSNDDFAQASVLEGDSVTVTGSTVGATAETGEPEHVTGLSAPTESIWYRWTAPRAGRVLVTTCGSALQVVLGAYNGTSVDALTRVTLNSVSLCPSGFQSAALHFPVAGGSVYHIAVDGNFSDEGAVTLTLQAFYPPANDNFADALTMTGLPASATGTNEDATVEPGEPAHADNSEFRNSVWYKWVAPATARVAVETCTDLDTTLGVYTGGSLDSLVVVGSNDNSGRCTVPGGSAVVFVATEGVPYRIAIDGWNNNTGPFTLTIRQLPATPPGNDDLADAELLTGTSDTATGSNEAATAEANEPYHEDTDGGPIQSVWYRWVAPASGNVHVATCDSNFNTTLAIYAGTDLTRADLRARSANSATCGGTTLGPSRQNAMTVAVTAGTTYYIAVDGYSDAEGTISLQLRLDGERPANDMFGDAELLEGGIDSATGSNVGASGEIGEPERGRIEDRPSTTVWYRWTAPASATTRVDLCGSYAFSSVIAYTGTTVTNLARVSGLWSSIACEGGSSRENFTFEATAGTAYSFAVDGWGTATGAVAIRVRNYFPLSTSLAGSGTGTISCDPSTVFGCNGLYQYGTTVTLSPTAGSDSGFTSWSGDCTGSAGCQVQMTAARSVTARFDSHTLTVTLAGRGNGGVTSNPAGINCSFNEFGSQNDTQCSKRLAPGTAVTLTATVGSQTDFVGWSGACTGQGPCSFTMETAKSVTATFAMKRFALTVARDGSEGSVGSDPAGISCGTDCSETYDANTQVTLRATFAGATTSVDWSGPCDTTTATECTVTMISARSVTALFRYSTVGIEDQSVVEGDSSRAVDFTLRLSKPAPVRVDATWETGASTALAGQDYVAASGSASFAPGEVAKPIKVTIVGDATAEPGEQFTITAYSTNATNQQGTVEIADNDIATPRMTAPTKAFQASPAFTLSWAPGRYGIPVNSFEVRYRRAPWNGTFGLPSMWRTNLQVSSATFSGSPGNTYCFQVRARGAKLSPWSPERCTALPLDDRSTTSAGAWTKNGTFDARYYRGTYSRSSTSGATLTRTSVSAKRLALLLTRCPTCGTARVYWNGTLARSLNLYAATTTRRVLLDVVSWSSPRAGTLVVRVYGSGKLVEIDGIGISRT